nr:ABC transporter ATP-binding protein [Phytoactinopolyspora halotolerans]
MVDEWPEPILEIRNLVTHFAGAEGTIRAVDDVTLTLERGSTLGIVGESGCGKSVTVRSILGLLPGQAQIVGGEILYRGRDERVVDLASLNPRGPEMRSVRGNEIAMIFQEPMAAFSPVYPIGRQIVEAVRIHTDKSKRDARSHVIEMLARVGVPQPERMVDRFPFELSGGLLQRAMIAMALSCRPSILIADEPTTALDVTVQGQVLTLLADLQREMEMSVILISHNMGVIAQAADVVAVMYMGRVVEQAPVWELFDNPQHPYTRALLESVPVIETEAELGGRLRAVAGDVPNPYDVPSGCRFHPRCTAFMANMCERAEPVLVKVGDEHTAACFLAEHGHGERRD